MSVEEQERILNFLSATLARIEVLEDKEQLTRAEVFELDMCQHDVKRARKALER